MALLAVDFCVYRLGTSRYHKDIPKIVLKRKKDEKYGDIYGCFFPDENVIHIFVNQHKTKSSFADTIIHEYVHYLQNPVKLDETSNKLEEAFGNRTAYNIDPHEMEAKTTAKLLRKECLSYIKSNYMN